MKTLVLGLVALALLECVCTQTQQSGGTTAGTYNNTSTTAWPSNYSSTVDPAGANHTSNQTSSTVTWTTGVTSTENKVTKNGQGRIVISFTLLLGSSVLPALWQ